MTLRQRRPLPIRNAAVAALAVLGASGASAEPVRWVSEPYPPFSYVSPEGPRGLSIELVRAAHREAGMAEPEFVFMPWARVLAELATQRPVCVTAMARTPARERSYRWIGPFVASLMGVATRRDTELGSNAATALAGRDVVAIRGDVAVEAATRYGAEPARLSLADGPESAVRMLNAGRVEAWVHGQAVIRWTIASMKLRQEDYAVQFPLRMGDSYFACSKAVPDSYLAAIQHGLDTLRRSKPGTANRYDNIVNPYLDGSIGP